MRFRTFAHYRVYGAMLDGVRRGGYVSRRAHAKLRAAEAARELSEAEASVPCVVSHIHVKLVEARGGRVLWYNRVLREVRVPMAEAELDARANAIASVGLLLESRDGLVELLKPPK